MMLVRDTLFAGLDFESAGEAPGLTDMPVQAGIAHMRGCELVPASFFRTAINPQRPVTRAAQKVHGLSAADLAAAPDMKSLWPEFRARLSGAVVVAHAAGTERRFLRAFPLHTFGPWLDTLTLARRAWPGLPDYSLEALAGSLGFRTELDTHCPGLAFHDALYDATGSLLVLRALITGARLVDRELSLLFDT